MSAETVPQLLKAIHRLRRHLRDLKSEIDLGPRVLKIQQQKLDAARQEHKDRHDEILTLKLKIRDDEGSLKQHNQQLAKFEKQLNDAGSPKEYEAKQSEIRQAKERIATSEEAILQRMEELETKTAALPTVDRTWAEAQQEFVQYQKDAAERLEFLQADQTKCQAELAETEVKLPATVMPMYLRLTKQYGADGLAGLVGRACQQCKMLVIEQVRRDVYGGGFYCCSHCGRGLYIADDAAW